MRHQSHHLRRTTKLPRHQPRTPAEATNGRRSGSDTWAISIGSTNGRRSIGDTRANLNTDAVFAWVVWLFFPLGPKRKGTCFKYRIAADNWCFSGCANLETQKKCPSLQMNFSKITHAKKQSSGCESLKRNYLATVDGQNVDTNFNLYFLLVKTQCNAHVSNVCPYICCWLNTQCNAYVSNVYP